MFQPRREPRHRGLRRKPVGKRLPAAALGLLIGLAAALLTLLLAQVFALDRAELASFDLRLRWRAANRLSDNDVQVLIVAIDEKTTGVGGYNHWPLPRGEYAPLVQYLKGAGARCVGFDLRFEEPDPPEDKQLAAALQRAGNAYLGARFDPVSSLFTEAKDITGSALDHALIGTNPVGAVNTRIRMKSAALPPARLAHSARALGSLTIIPEVDGVVRRFPLVAAYVRPGDPSGKVHLYASLPLLMAADMLHVPLEQVRVRLGDAITIGNHRIPINESGEMVINYYGGFRALYHLPYIDVIRRVYEPRYFRDKAVILGNTLSGGFDIQVTPYSGQYPGVEAQATVLQNILDGSAITPAAPWICLLILFAGALVIGATRTRSIAVQITVALLTAVTIVAASFWLLAAHYLWIEMVRPLAAVLLAFAGVSLSTFLDMQSERARVQGAVEALSEVSSALAHTRNPAELLPALEHGIMRVLDTRQIRLDIHDHWLREQLLPDAPAEPQADAADATFIPLLLRGKEVGQIAVQPDDKAADPGLVNAAKTFAALSLENAALFEEHRSYFFNVTLMLAEIIESKDHYTAGHCTRVMEYACAIGERLGLAPEEMDQLRYAALLHDVGKIGVREAILNKPGALTPEEREEMRRHPALGRQWLHRERRLRAISELVATHHECWDGSGYPEGLAGEAIPLGGRIVAVADVWDALTSDRPYRPALAYAEARRHIERGRGTQFEPRVAEVFLAYLEENR